MVNFPFRRSFNTGRPVQHDQTNLFKNSTLKIPNSQKHCSKQKLMRREPRRQTGNLQSKRRLCRELSQNCAEQMPLLEVTISFGSSLLGRVKKVQNSPPVLQITDELYRKLLLVPWCTTAIRMTTSWRVFGKHETELRKFGRKKPLGVVPYAVYFTMWTGYIEGQFCIANKRLFFSFLFKKNWFESIWNYSYNYWTITWSYQYSLMYSSRAMFLNEEKSVDE